MTTWTGTPRLLLIYSLVLAIALAARAEPGDTVLVRSVWWTAPINYYLRAP